MKLTRSLFAHILSIPVRIKALRMLISFIPTVKPVDYDD